MRQYWLRPNRRVLLAGMLIPGLVLLAGVGLVGWGLVSGMGVSGWLGVVLILLGAVLLAALGYAMYLPRLAYEDGHLLVFLGAIHPVRIPIEVVECFFFGQGPALMPARRWGDPQRTQTSTVVVRLAESAVQWHQGPARRALGQWCDGYITIRGTWCEPLSGEVLSRLNARLVEVHREIRRNRQEEPA